MEDMYNLLKLYREYLNDTLRFYRRFYHNIYAKAVRYVITKKINLIHISSNKKSLISLWSVSKHFVLVGSDNNILLATCTCPDFFYNTTLQANHIGKSRKFCSHIIATFICLYSLTESTEYYKCNIHIREAKGMFEILSALESFLRADDFDSKES